MLYGQRQFGDLLDAINAQAATGEQGAHPACTAATEAGAEEAEEVLEGVEEVAGEGGNGQGEEPATAATAPMMQRPSAYATQVVGDAVAATASSAAVDRPRAVKMAKHESPTTFEAFRVDVHGGATLHAELLAWTDAFWSAADHAHEMVAYRVSLTAPRGNWSS